MRKVFPEIIGEVTFQWLVLLNLQYSSISKGMKSIIFKFGESHRKQNIELPTEFYTDQQKISSSEKEEKRSPKRVDCTKFSKNTMDKPYIPKDSKTEHTADNECPPKEKFKATLIGSPEIQPHVDKFVSDSGSTVPENNAQRNIENKFAEYINHDNYKYIMEKAPQKQTKQDLVGKHTKSVSRSERKDRFADYIPDQQSTWHQHQEQTN